MYTVMSLCHFCEHHGPSIMFSCEKVLPTETTNGNVERPDTTSNPDDEGKSSSPQTSNKIKESSIKKTDLCQACRSLPEDKEAFVSNDKETGSTYLSTQHPHNSEMFKRVRQACVRSLSGEVCPGRQGPILFGDEQHGYVISYTFYINDNLARGQKRMYSIICMMADRVFLIQSWTFLVGCIERVIEYMQNCADYVYKTESKEQPQLPARVHARMTNAITPRNFRQLRGDTSNSRALIQLTGNAELYQYLHTAFTWIMRHCRTRIQEHIIFAPPIDDDIVRAEILARSKRSNSVISNEDVALAVANEELRTKSLSEASDNEVPYNCFRSLRHMRDILQPPLFKAVAWHLLIGNQVIWRGHDQNMVSSALQVLKTIIPVGCVKMVTDSNVYVNSYESNLLGLRETVALPSHVKSSDQYILVDIVRKASASQRLSQLSLSASPPTAFGGIEFRMTSGCIIPEKMPVMLHKLEVALANDSLSAEVVKHCLICLKQEWMNKTKVLFKFVKIDNRDKEDTNKLLQVCLSCTEEDTRLLKFWMTGLSFQFKEKLRQSARAEKSMLKTS
uniref:Folliculin n=1 Tax=Phallusia mammillata TaxID=59560 RepID=A0A6F9DCB3_9ASCI|nr:folliculin-like [Phallusia mammillata]